MLLLPGRRPVPLLYARDGASYVVAATNWGRPAHPGWSAGLLLADAAEIEVDRSIVQVAVSLLGAAEVERVWPALTSVWPAFDVYRSRSGRDIRVFSLAPR